MKDSLANRAFVYAQAINKLTQEICSIPIKAFPENGSSDTIKLHIHFEGDVYLSCRAF